MCVLLRKSVEMKGIFFHSWDKLQGILSTLYGWVIGLGLAVVDYFAGHAFIVYLVAAVTLMDAFFGIVVSIKQGRFALSELGRLTIDKFVVYGCALFVFVGLDRFAGTTLTASIIGASIVLIEFWSSCASMTILYPQMPFLKLMRHVLLGEIASKLNIQPEEVDEYLNKVEN